MRLDRREQVKILAVCPLFIDIDGKLRVLGAKDAKGLARLRFEIPLYSHRNQGTKKIDDDAIDGWRGLKSTFGVQSGDKTKGEKVQDRLPESIKVATIALMPDSDIKDAYIQKNRIETLKLEKEMNKPVRHPGMKKFGRR